MIWIVWRDAGGNLGVSSYPDTQLARYACNALGRVVIDYKDTKPDAEKRAAELAPRFAGGRLVYVEEPAVRRERCGEHHAGCRLCGDVFRDILNGFDP